MPQPPDPRMAQWQLRYDAAMRSAKAAEASRNPAAVQAAYREVSKIQMSRPQNKPAPAAPAPAQQKPSGLAGTFNYIRNALAGNPQN